MKKLLLLLSSVAIGLSANAQAVYPSNAQSVPVKLNTGNSLSTAKTTAVIHDTLVMSHLNPGDTLIYTYRYHGDSGIVTGNNYAGRQAYAERYTFNAADSTIQVIGVAGFFVGTVNAASTKTVSLKVWNSASLTSTTRPTLFFTGFPTAAIDSVTIPYTSLHISPLTLTIGYFATPTAYLNDSFFVGYSTAYSWTSLSGDTVGLGCTLNGNRTTPVWNISGSDTTVNVVNALQQSNGSWLDFGYNMGFKTNLFVFPIVNSKVTLSTRGITRNDFTFFGNYPNPAVNSTNFKFSLNKGTDVTIQIVNENGQVINTISKPNLAAGEHLVNFETANLAAGNYLAIFRTAEGDGIASKLTVIK